MLSIQSLRSRSPARLNVVKSRRPGGLVGDNIGMRRTGTDEAGCSEPARFWRCL
jgi:hypothetical protein